MKRPALILSGTVVGLVGLLGYRALTPSLTTFVVAPNASSTSTTVPPVTTTTAAPPPRSPTTTTAPTTSRSATGELVNYIYGVLSVQVTTSGSKITKVAIGSINDGGNYRSQSIDQMAIPQLEQQALSLQSAHIQGVSGASYTSAGFSQSLQSALSKLGL